MNSCAAINIVSPTQFDRATAQTPGSERRAAIAPALGIASAIWGGLFEVEPGSRTGIHHHGEQETVAYVLSASARFAGEKRRVGRACKGRRFYSCPRVPAAHGNQSFEPGAVPVGCRAKH